MENEKDETIVDSQETNEEGVEESAEETNEETKEEKPKESLEDRRARLERQLKQVNKKLGISGQPKRETPKEESTGDQTLSPKDYLALTEHKVTSEDFDEVIRVAKILGKPVNEALKDKTLQSILNDRNEERLTAQATQTKGSRSASKTTGADILEKARRGEFPKTDADIDKLVEARFQAKLNRNK